MAATRGRAEGLHRARSLMERFAHETGLSSDRPRRRYLWTDAFAVCNYLGFHERKKDGDDLELALTLVDQVHATLGRHRDDDPRTGWISGLDEEEGLRHPTAGGLRIGKPLPERPESEPLDERREWSRDGQYFHYLTRWMHALHRVAEVTGQERYHDWAVELARVAVRRFSVTAGTGARLIWKMSTDLSRALVRSTGQHDALDGYVTLALLKRSPDELDSEIRLLGAMVHGQVGQWGTTDPLGVGGLLVHTYHWDRLVRMGSGEPGLLKDLLSDAAASLDAVANSTMLRRDAETRLAFRELGLSIGLAAAERMSAPSQDDGAHASIGQHSQLREAINDYWSAPAHRRAPSWTDHEDISAVMLATALAPEGYLGG